MGTTIGDKFYRSHELTKKDAEIIFGLVMAAKSTMYTPEPGEEENCIHFYGFLAALHMVAKRMRRPLNDVLTGFSFSHLSPIGPHHVDLSMKGVMRRVRQVF